MKNNTWPFFTLNNSITDLLFFHKQQKDNFMETEESKELTLAQEETIKKTLEEIRKQDPKKTKESTLSWCSATNTMTRMCISLISESRISSRSVSSYNCKRKTKSQLSDHWRMTRLSKEIRNWWMMIPCSCMACPQNWSISLVPAKPRSQISRSLASKG